MAKLNKDDLKIGVTFKPCGKCERVEVVRCNKCTYWDKATTNKKGFLVCPASGMEITARDYCSYGERREGE